MIEVRPATVRDVTMLCELYRDFHEFHVRGMPTRLETLTPVWEDEKAKLAARLRDVIGNPDSEVLVAVEGGRLLGLSEVYLCEDEPVRGRVSRRYCHLQSMFVASERRRKGVGRLLLSASESWAMARGLSEIRLDMWEFPEGPLEFYERCGYRTYRRSLARDLA